MNQYELYHHGVKGMKWGQRKAQLKSAGSKMAGYGRSAGSKMAGYGRSAGSKINKTAKTAAPKVKSFNNPERKVKVSKNDKKVANGQWKNDRRNYVKGQSGGKRAAKFLLAGPTGAHLYNTMRASGHGRASSVGATYASNLLGGPIGNVAIDNLVSGNYKEKKY